MDKANTIGEDLAIAWFSLPEGRVRKAVYDKEVARFRPLLSRIRKQEKEQGDALLKLKVSISCIACVHIPIASVVSGAAPACARRRRDGAGSQWWFQGGHPPDARDRF